MDGAIEDGIGDRGVAEIRVPLIGRQLTGNDRRAGRIAILYHLEEVLALHVRHGGETPVIEDRDVQARQPCQHRAVSGHRRARAGS